MGLALAYLFRSVTLREIPAALPPSPGACMKLLSASILALSLSSPAMAFDLTQMSDAERAAFRAEVRSYLLENPEVLSEAIDVLHQRQDATAAANDLTLVKTYAEDLFKDPASWIGGNPDGDITLVEFTDYRCGYCRKAHDEVAELVKSDGNIRFIVKEYPILGDASMISSKFAIAVLQVAGPDAYHKAHEALITLRGEPSVDVLQRLAGDLGVDTAAVMAKMDTPEVAAVINANHALGNEMAITGTPMFVVQSTMLRGYVPLEDMRQIVAEQRKG